MKTKVARIFMGLRNIRWRAYPHVSGHFLQTAVEQKLIGIRRASAHVVCATLSLAGCLKQYVTLWSPRSAQIIRIRFLSKLICVPRPCTLPYCAIMWLTPHAFNGRRNSKLLRLIHEYNKYKMRKLLKLVFLPKKYKRQRSRCAVARQFF